MRALKLLVFVITVAIVIATIGCAPTATNGIPREHLVSPGRFLGHASIDVTIEGLRNVFGREQRTSVERDRPRILHVAWSAPGQPGIRATMIDGRAIWIQAFMLDTYRTINGLRVGSSKEDALSLYGEPSSKLLPMYVQIGANQYPAIIWEYAIGLSVTIRTDTESVVAIGVTRAR